MVNEFGIYSEFSTSNVDYAHGIMLVKGHFTNSSFSELCNFIKKKLYIGYMSIYLLKVISDVDRYNI